MRERLRLATGLTAAAVMILAGLPPASGSEGGDESTFSGSKTCKKRHVKHYKSWEKAKMAKTFEVLKPNEVSDKKVSANLDPAKDYTTEAEYLRCHMVGFGAASG